MVVLWISAPNFGLATELLFAVTELGLLVGLLNVLNYSVSRRLSNHEPVKICAYRRWVMALSFGSLLTFFTAEFILSLFSDPKVVFENRDCLRNFVGTGEDDDSAEEKNMYNACTDVNDTIEIQRTGNYSLKTGEVLCNDIGYYFKIGQRLPYRRAMGRTVRRCTDGLCAAVAWQEISETSGAVLPHKGILYVSQMVPRSFPDRRLEMMPTYISEINLSDQLEPLCKRAASLYAIPINEERELRRRMLLRFENLKCLYVDEEVDITEVAIWALVISGTIWGLSVVLFLSSLFLRRETFFDMGNPLHWAKAARHDSARSYGKVPALRIGEGEKGLIWITEFSQDENDLRA